MATKLKHIFLKKECNTKPGHDSVFLHLSLFSTF